LIFKVDHKFDRRLTAAKQFSLRLNNAADHVRGLSFANAGGHLEHIVRFQHGFLAKVGASWRVGTLIGS
jgi:hypothetical protein